MQTIHDHTVQFADKSASHLINIPYSLRTIAAVGVQNDGNVWIWAARSIVGPLPHTVRQARVEVLRFAQEEGVCDQSLC